VGEHLLGALEIADHSSGKWCPYDDITAFAAGHIGGFLAERNYLLGDFIDSDERRLVQHNTAALDGNDGARRPKVDRHRICY
jgi:hypothetical protein